MKIILFVVFRNTLSKFLFTKRIGGLALQITFIQLIMHRANIELRIFRALRAEIRNHYI